MQAANALIPATDIALQPLTTEHPAFSYLLSVNISVSTAHAYIKEYNARIGANTTLHIQNPAFWIDSSFSTSKTANWTALGQQV